MAPRGSTSAKIGALKAANTKHKRSLATQVNTNTQLQHNIVRLKATNEAHLARRRISNMIDKLNLNYMSSIHYFVQSGTALTPHLLVHLASQAAAFEHSGYARNRDPVELKQAIHEWSKKFLHCHSPYVFDDAALHKIRSTTRGSTYHPA